MSIETSLQGFCKKVCTSQSCRRESVDGEPCHDFYQALEELRKLKEGAKRNSILVAGEEQLKYALRMLSKAESELESSVSGSKRAIEYAEKLENRLKKFRSKIESGEIAGPIKK